MLKALSLLMILCMATAYIGDTYFKNKRPPSFSSLYEQAMDKIGFSSTYGFTKIPSGSLANNDNAVLALMPVGAPPDAQMRLNKLFQALAKKGIPHKQVSSFNFNFASGTDEFIVRKIDVALQSEAPIVVVKNWIKANPVPGEVIDLYNK